MTTPGGRARRRLSALSRRLVAGLLAGCLSGPPAAAGGVEGVNRLRTAAGLPPLAPNPALAEAAQRHARYLDRHRAPGARGQGVSAHVQRPAAAGFSGATPADRALAAGYPHRAVLENVSIGFGDGDAAIDGLMGAIYHRLAFLDLLADQIGIAAGERSRVFLLGRGDLATLCTSPPPEALYRRPVDCLGQPMRRSFYQGLCAALPDAALLHPAHPIRCRNGRRLDADFMAQTCADPPPAARFAGSGRYYLACGDETAFDADWFDALCDAPPPGADAPGSGRYVELCDGPRQVALEWFESLCARLPEDARYTDSGGYLRPCADDSEIRVEYLDAVDEAAAAALPLAVMWPPPGATDVPPAFFIEEPDPLPDLAVSGYPVSVQFNPGRAGRVEVQDFALFQLGDAGRSAVEPLRRLDRASDPNQLLSDHEYAWFPLQRLRWGTTYAVVVDATVDGRPLRLEWTFATRGQGLTLVTAQGPSSRFMVPVARPFLLYLPPGADGPHTVLSRRVTHHRGNAIEIEMEDPNTLRVQLRVRYCGPFLLQFDSGRTVELIPAPCAG